MKKITGLLTLIFIASLFSCTQPAATSETSKIDTAKEQQQINTMLDSFNAAAAKADFNTYFNFYTDDAIFTGTDATERWDKNEFDELLNTQMKICRGSGVLVKQGKDWKVQQYILSATVPNDILNTVIKLKAPVEDSIINKLSEKNESKIN